jgi:hypothetical protein
MQGCFSTIEKMDEENSGALLPIAAIVAPIIDVDTAQW